MHLFLFFSVSLAKPTEKIHIFLCLFLYFCVDIHTEKLFIICVNIFFFVRVTPIEKLFLTVNPQKNSIFCHFISMYIFLTVQCQKNIFLTVFTFFCGFCTHRSILVWFLVVERIRLAYVLPLSFIIILIICF